MISAFASIVLALTLNLKTPLFVPIIYLASYWRRDFFLLSIIFYFLFLGYEFTVEQFYYDIALITVLTASLLLLEEGLRAKERKNAHYLLSFSTLVGFISLEALLSVLLVSFGYYIYQDKPKKGAIALLFPIFVIFLFVFFGKTIYFIGSSATQAILIASITSLMSLFWVLKFLQR